MYNEKLCIEIIDNVMSYELWVMTIYLVRKQIVNSLHVYFPQRDSFWFLAPAMFMLRVFQIRL